MKNSMENVISSIVGWRQVWILLYYRVMFLLALCEGTSDQLSQLINLLVSTFPLFVLFSLFTCYSHYVIIIVAVIIRDLQLGDFYMIINKSLKE